MRRRSTLIWLLVLSITINVFFLISYMIHHGSVQDSSSKQTEYFLNRHTVLEALPNDSAEIIFAGDSHIQNFELAELFGTLQVKNRGINGDDIPGVINRVNEIIESSPKMVILMVGVNDLGSGTSVSNAIIHYRELLRIIEEQSPNTEIYLHTLFPVEEPNGYYKSINPEIRTFNHELKLLSESMNLQFIDFYNAFEENGKLNAEYSADGLHLNGKGYLLWTKLLKQALKL